MKETTRMDVATSAKMDRRAVLTGAAATAGLTVASPALAAAPGRGPAALNALLNDVSEALLQEYPETATFLGVDRSARAALERRLTDRSAAADAARAASCRSRLGRLRAFEASSVNGLDNVNLRATLYAHELADAGYRFPYGDNAVLNVWQAESTSPYVVGSATAAFATVPDLLDTNQRLETEADADAYLSRLEDLARALDAETGRLQRDGAAGVMAPDFLLDTTIAQQQRYRAQPVAGWGLVTSLSRRASIKGFGDTCGRRALRLCEQEVAPALDRQIAALTTQRTKACSDAGVWKLPDGVGYYRWALEAGTTTSMSPDEVHHLGLDQVRELTSEMDDLLRTQGLTQGSVGARMSALGRDSRFLYPDTDTGRQQLLAYLNGVIADVRPRLPQAFAILPKADLVIKPVPAAIQAGAPGGYEVDGPVDGSRPATYYINLRKVTNWPRYHLPTLCFHEGIPGHVWQGNFAHGLPLIRSQLAFNAYVEGWALYAEQLGDELGMYADNPFGRIGYLQSIQWRACRLVIDTGLHAKRWTRDAAIDWLVEHNGATRDAAQHEIDRYCAWPGQACGYQVGHLYINRLRAAERARLAPRFQLQAFNDAVLTCGSVPLNLLDAIVQTIPASDRSSPTG